MSLPSKDFEVGGLQLRITALGSKAGMTGLVRLMNVLGPALGKLISGAKPSDVGEANLDVGAAMTELFSTIREADLDYFVTEFSKVTEVLREHGYVRVEKLGVERDRLWAANYGAMFVWLRECVELNYADFLAGAGAIARPGSAEKA